MFEHIDRHVVMVEMQLVELGLIVQLLIEKKLLMYIAKHEQ